MKILHLLDEPWDSGITAYALEIAELLQRHGETVVLGVRPNKKPAEAAKALNLTPAFFETPWDLRRILRSQRWDLVNAHTGRSHTWSVMWEALRRGSTPVIRTRGDARDVNITILDRVLYARTAAVIAASEHIRRQYEQQLKWDDERLVTVYPGFASDGGVQPAPSLRVGIVGRLDPVKGHAFFLEAAAHVLRQRPDVTFAIAGKEAGVTYQLLRNQMAALGIPAPSIQFSGFVPSALEFMRACSIGVISSVGSEEISRACIEWMSVGRPVVGTLVGSLPELIEPGETGMLVPPGDSTGIGEAILELLRDPARAAALGHNAHRRAAKSMSPAVQLERTLGVYRAALARRSR